jgi:hypothetical protein
VPPGVIHDENAFLPSIGASSCRCCRRPSLAAYKAVQGPNGLSLNCADFTRHEDGSWSSDAQATVNYPDRPGSFANIADVRGIEMYDV